LCQPHGHSGFGLPSEFFVEKCVFETNPANSNRNYYDTGGSQRGYIQALQPNNAAGFCSLNWKNSPLRGGSCSNQNPCVSCGSHCGSCKQWQQKKISTCLPANISASACKTANLPASACKTANSVCSATNIED
jgi:hypothetical protein